MLYLPFLRQFVEIGTLTVIDRKSAAHRVQGGGDGLSATVRVRVGMYGSGG